jgi:WD40 repeat protein
MARLNIHKYFLIIAVMAMGGFVAGAVGIRELPSAQETHGKLPVKLSEKFTLQFPLGATGVAWSPDSSILAVSSNVGMKLNTYDGSGHSLSEFKSEGNLGAYVNSFAFINGASQVLFPIESSSDVNAALDIRDVATGRVLKTITRTRDNNYSPNATDVLAVSHDQKRIAIGTGILQGFIVFSTDDGKQWHELSSGARGKLGATSFCFFPDGKLLAIGKGDGHFAVVDSSTGETLKEFQAYDAPGIHDNVDGLAVSPKGDLILIGLDPVAISYDVTPEASAWERSNHALASVWRISDGKQIAGFPDRNKLIRQAVWDPEGRFVAFIDTDSLVVWNPEAPGENFIRIKLPGLSTSLAISRDGKSLAVAGGHSAIVYNIKDNQ